jgi:adenylate cyclase, class 2
LTASSIGSTNSITSGQCYIRVWNGMLEVEIKARVPDLVPVRERILLGHGGTPVRVHERDVYYNAPHRDFGTTDEALRLRYAGGSCTLTYKGKKMAEYRLKAREELNCGVESGEVMETILKRLGFVQVAEVEKWREYYSYRGATVSLDEVKGLGSFVEIEAPGSPGMENPEEYVRDIAKELGVEGEPILASYLELLLAIP